MFIDKARVEFDTIQMPMVVEFNLQHDITHVQQEQQLFTEMVHTVLAKAEEVLAPIMVV